MSSCPECGKTLASPVGLRRHINSQHRRSEWHVCECGRQFLDPAARSRCRAGHSRSFACPLRDCLYRSNRKDCVKQHIRRRHHNFMDPPVLTLSQGVRTSRHPSTDEELGRSLATSQVMTPSAHYSANTQSYGPDLWHPQPSVYFSGPFAGSWFAYQ